MPTPYRYLSPCGDILCEYHAFPGAELLADGATFSCDMCERRRVWPYKYLEAARGDWGRGGAPGSFSKSLRAELGQARTPEERAHALDQVAYFQACRAISYDLGTELRDLIQGSRQNL